MMSRRSRSTPAPAKSAPRSRNMIYYKTNLRGVLDWARGDVYFQGEVPSAEEIELFDERFTTQANQGFTNPQEDPTLAIIMVH